MDRRRRKVIVVGTAAVLVVVALVTVVSVGCGSDAAASGGPLNLTEADNGKAYTVAVGDTVTVAIVGNPTTGYAWTADLSDEDAALLQATGEPVYDPDVVAEGIVGSGGTYTFTFNAVAKGEVELKLIYWRSFEPDVAPMQTFTATVTIE
jgi:inhibitor of cysteine peptidase